MSDEQTVREALDPWESVRASDGMMAIRGRSADDLAGALGIDPDMSVFELQRRLRIAEAFERDVLKVIICDCMLAINADAPEYPPIIPPTAIDWIGDRLVGAVLAWATREDDQ